MQTTVQNLSKSQVEIKIEVAPEEFQSFIEKAVSVLGENIEVEGFRKGKAPKEVIWEKVGEQNIMQQAAQECIKDVYPKAAKEKNIEPLGQPAVEIMKLVRDNPFEFKVKVAVMPEIKLPDYKKIASQIKKQDVKVSQAEIDHLMEQKEKKEKERLRQEILEKITKDSELEVPDVLIESEKARMLADIKMQVPQMLGISFDDYLKKINKTEQNLVVSFKEEAETRVKTSLILREIEKQENINLTEKEMEDKMQEIAQMAPGLDKDQLREYTESVLKNEKAFQILEDLIKS